LAAEQRDFDEFLDKFRKHRDIMTEELHKVIIGQDTVIEQILAAIFTGGHCLLVGVPGLAKTLLVSTVSKILHLSFKRIQFTPDLMPADITGTDILQDDPETGRRSFAFIAGPLFANIILADEINRTPPKTQAALLEAMEERQVSIDGHARKLPDPFLVVATQNPIEHEGTYPLPEAQLDRFLFRLAMGYPSQEAEREVLRGNSKVPEIDALEPVMSDAEVLAMSEWATGVTVSDAVVDYIIELCTATRDDSSLALGAGPRASQALMWAARVLAASQGREDVYPDDVRVLLPAVIGHRVLLGPDAILRGEAIDSVLERVVSAVRPPSVAAASSKSRSR